MKRTMLGIIMTLLSACSTVREKDLTVLRTQDQETRQIAEQALNTAREAQRLAADANSRVLQTQEALNRSYKKSMFK